MEINEERPEIRPLRSGQETVRRRLEANRLGAVPDLGYGRVEEEVEDPVRGDPGPALRALELVQVRGPPEQGGYEAAELDVHHLVDSEVAPYLDELADGLVVEGPHLPAVYGREDVPRDDLAFLDGGLGVRRHRSTVLLDRRGAVADAPDVLLPVGEDHAVRPYLLGLHPVADLYLKVGELLAGRAPEGRVELFEDLLVAVDEHDLDPVRVYVRVVGREDVVDEGVELCRDLDPCGPAAYHDERQARVRHLPEG